MLSIIRSEQAFGRKLTKMAKVTDGGRRLPRSVFVSLRPNSSSNHLKLTIKVVENLKSYLLVTNTLTFPSKMSKFMANFTELWPENRSNFIKKIHLKWGETRVTNTSWKNWRRTNLVFVKGGQVSGTGRASSVFRDFCDRGDLCALGSSRKICFKSEK